MFFKLFWRQESPVCLFQDDKKIAILRLTERKYPTLRFSDLYMNNFHRGI